MKSKNKILLIVATMAALLVASQAVAGNTWICSINQVVAVDEDGTIGPPDMGGIAIPTFMRVDAEKKWITLLAPEERRGQVTKIDSVHQGEGVWVFSGVESERAWSLVIADVGYMTLSVTMDGAVWSVFGSAMLEE